MLNNYILSARRCFAFSSRSDMCTGIRYVLYLALNGRSLELSVGSEIYVGCSDGTLLRYALQATGPDSVSALMA